MYKINYEDKNLGFVDEKFICKGNLNIQIMYVHFLNKFGYFQKILYKRFTTTSQLGM